MSGYHWRGSDLTVEFMDASVAAEFVEAIVDLDDSGEVIGIEILGIVARHPLLPDRISQTARSAVHVTCDQSADAIYLRFSNERSFDQVARPAVVVLGPDDTLIQIAVRIE